MMDWLGKMLELPEEFLFSGPGRGGGVIQVCTFELSRECEKVLVNKKLFKYYNEISINLLQKKQHFKHL